MVYRQVRTDEIKDSVGKAGDIIQKTIYLLCI